MRHTKYPFLCSVLSFERRMKSSRKYTQVHFPPRGDTELNTLEYSYGCLQTASQCHISLVLFIIGLIYQANFQGSMLMDLS